MKITKLYNTTASPISFGSVTIPATNFVGLNFAIFLQINSAADFFEKIASGAIVGKDESNVSATVEQTIDFASDILGKINSIKSSIAATDEGLDDSKIDRSEASGNITISPNVTSIFGTFTSVTIALESPKNIGLRNEYSFIFTSGTTASAITWPAGLKWSGGTAPILAASKTYEVSILNNLAVIASY